MNLPDKAVNDNFVFYTSKVYKDFVFYPSQRILEAIIVSIK